MRLSEGSRKWNWVVKDPVGVMSSWGLWCECNWHFDDGVQVEGNWKMLGYGQAEQLKTLISKSRFFGMWGVDVSSHRSCDHGRIFTIQGSDVESDSCVWLRWNRHKVNRTGAKSKLREKITPSNLRKYEKNYEYKNEWWELISYCLELHLESNYIAASSSTSILQFFSGRVILFLAIMNVPCYEKTHLL